MGKAGTSSHQNTFSSDPLYLIQAKSRVSWPVLEYSFWPILFRPRLPLLVDPSRLAASDDSREAHHLRLPVRRGARPRACTGEIITAPGGRDLRGRDARPREAGARTRRGLAAGARERHEGFCGLARQVACQDGLGNGWLVAGFAVFGLSYSADGENISQ